MPPRRGRRHAEEHEDEVSSPPAAVPAAPPDFTFGSIRRLKRTLRRCADCHAVVPPQYGTCHMCRCASLVEDEEDYTVAEASWGPKKKMRRVEVAGLPNQEALKIRLLREG